MEKLPPFIPVKGVRRFLGHTGLGDSLKISQKLHTHCENFLRMSVILILMMLV